MINPIDMRWDMQEKEGDDTTKEETQHIDEKCLNETPPETPRIKIEVRASGRLQGTHEMEYIPGKTLLMYLRELGATALLRRLRILDISHVELGRRRSSYVLQEDSHIVMLSSRAGLSSHLQRGFSGDDVKRLAHNMGGGKRVVEVNINYQNNRSDK